MKEYYTTKDIVSVFHVNIDTAERMCREGRIRTTKVGRQWRINPAEWRRLLREGITMKVVVEEKEPESPEATNGSQED